MFNALLILCYCSILLNNIESSEIEKCIQTRIIGGTNIPITHRPFVISIHRRHDGFVCGGVILSSKWIITALHCIPVPRLKAEFYIRAGSRFYDRGGTYHILRKIKLYNSSVVHDFGATVPIHDISLVEVFPQFQFSTLIFPAKLPKQFEEPPNQLWVSGWGITAFKRLSKTLQTTSVRRIPNHICHNMSEMYTILMSVDRHICYGGTKRDSCNGDSGGPLEIARTIYGLVSFGEDCGRLPGVYVKISYYSEWISSIIQKDL